MGRRRRLLPQSGKENGRILVLCPSLFSVGPFRALNRFVVHARASGDVSRKTSLFSEFRGNGARRYMHQAEGKTIEQDSHDSFVWCE